MTQYEKEEIGKLPEKYRPLTAWGYFGYSILFSLPLIGFICLIVFSFSSSNINRRSFARSYFCVMILSLIVMLVILFTGVGATIVENITSKVVG